MSMRDIVNVLNAAHVFESYFVMPLNEIYKMEMSSTILLPSIPRNRKWASAVGHSSNVLS
jgi:hypothetical protein